MAVFNKFNAFTEHLSEGVHNLGSHTLKILLSNAAPSQSLDAVRADLTSELGTAGGYTSGGTAVTVTSSAQTAGVYKLVGDPVVFTAAGGDIGPFQYAILYNDTPSSPADPLIGYWDNASAITVLEGGSFTVNLDDTDGILTVT